MIHYGLTSIQCWVWFKPLQEMATSSNNEASILFITLIYGMACQSNHLCGDVISCTIPHLATPRLCPYLLCHCGDSCGRMLWRYELIYEYIREGTKTIRFIRARLTSTTLSVSEQICVVCRWWWMVQTRALLSGPDCRAPMLTGHSPSPITQGSKVTRSQPWATGYDL